MMSHDPRDVSLAVILDGASQDLQCSILVDLVAGIWSLISPDSCMRLTSPRNRVKLPRNAQHKMECIEIRLRMNQWVHENDFKFIWYTGGFISLTPKMIPLAQHVCLI